MALNKIKKLIDSAQKTIQVASYTFTHMDLCDALIRAHKRGVHVQVLFDKESSNYTSQKVFQKLKKAHIQVYTRTIQGLMHHKFSLIDNEYLITGSANWTKAAFSINDDISMFIYPITNPQKNFMKKNWDEMMCHSTM